MMMILNTAHLMIDQNWKDSLNYQTIQSVNVLKDMIDVRDCIKELICVLLYSFFNDM